MKPSGSEERSGTYENGHRQNYKHALTPEADELWIARGPSLGKERVESRGHADDNAVARNVGGEGGQGGGGEIGGREVAQGDDGRDDQAVFEDMGAGKGKKDKQ